MKPGEPAQRVLFLDIDGVLNGHEFNDTAQSNSIKPTCMGHLNRILEETGAALVIASAWRYMVLKGAMTLTGFNYLLRTHGMRAGVDILGVLGEDDQREQENRAKLVLDWLGSPEGKQVRRYVVVDDLDLHYSMYGLPFVETDGKVGLTEAEALCAIKLLKRGRY